MKGADQTRSKPCLLVVELGESADCGSGAVVRLETIPAKTAWVIAAVATVYGGMGGNTGHWDPKGRLPEQHLTGKVPVLNFGVAGMAILIVPTVSG